MRKIHIKTERYLIKNCSAAAHCLVSEKKDLTFEFGRWKTNVGDIDCENLDDYDNCDSFLIIPAKKFFIHENSSLNDIAIIKMEWPVMYTDLIKPICLPSVNDVLKDKDLVVVTGFGNYFVTLKNNTMLLISLLFFRTNQH